jgi:hypothetical protein
MKGLEEVVYALNVSFGSLKEVSTTKCTGDRTSSELSVPDELFELA